MTNGCRRRGETIEDIALDSSALRGQGVVQFIPTDVNDDRQIVVRAMLELNNARRRSSVANTVPRHMYAESSPGGHCRERTACDARVIDRLSGAVGRSYTRRMIHGAHVIIYSKDAEADRAFFRDVLKYESVDVGHGWLIFALPPTELAVHPSEENDIHELFLMCDDVQALIAEMKKKKVKCSPVDEQRWGSITRLTLPGGGKLGVYQPKHVSPLKTRAT
jgi:hypothetical protein